MTRRTPKSTLEYLDAVAVVDGAFVYPVPPTARDRWHIVTVPAGVGKSRMPAHLRLRAGADSCLEHELYLHDLPAGIGRGAVVYLRLDIECLHLTLFGRDVPATVRIGLRPLARGAAALLLMAWHPVRFITAFRRETGAWRARGRAAIYEVATSGSAPPSYAQWVALFDRWDAAAIHRLMHSPRRDAWPRLSVILFHAGAGTDARLAASLQALADQPMPIPHAVVTGTGAAARQALDGVLQNQTSDYVVLLQAGELVPPHALALLADQIARRGGGDALFADEDELTRAGRRCRPRFKPEASHSLMLSGSLTRGVWAFRREHLLYGDAGAGAGAGRSVWAETVRLETWLRLCEGPAVTRTLRLPFVLTHRMSNAEIAPPEAVAHIVEQHIARTALPARVEQPVAFPLRVRFELPRGQQPKVSIIVPTAARLPHVTRCLRGVLDGTAYDGFELLIVVSQPGPLAPQQQRILAPVLQDPRARLVLLETATFNYSHANNYGASLSDGALICLLNDDVEPMRPDWLGGLAGHLADDRVGIVGAKLLYRDRTIQHAGVVMGLGGIAEHVHRHLPSGKSGYAGRAGLNQEFSAVTGACLLVRRSVFQAVGGLDESFPIAFNDLDFCLRVREAGWGVVLSAQTEMWHEESTSLGHHFSGERASAERVETARMRSRWRAVCSSDPYHNPNLSLRRGDEWEPAFPPRNGHPD